MLLLLLDWTTGTFRSWMVWPNRSRSIQPPPQSCKGPGSTLHTRGYPSTPTCRALRARACWALQLCVQGLPGLDHRGEEGYFQCRLWGGHSSGWSSLRASSWRAPRLLTGGFASDVAVPVPAAPLWCDLSLFEAGRAGLGEDGGRCRGGVDSGIGNSPFLGRSDREGNQTGDISIIVWASCARVACWDPTQCNDDIHVLGMLSWGYGRDNGMRIVRPVDTSCYNKGWLSACDRCRYGFWSLVVWMLHIGRARHPGPGCRPLWQHHH